jgi:uroporphyrinogen-III synthase
MEQNGWEALKTKMVFCVGIKTKELLEANGFTGVYMDYALN